MRRQIRRCLRILWWLICFDLLLVSLLSIGEVTHILNLEKPLQWIIKTFNLNKNTSTMLKYPIPIVFHQTYSSLIVPQIYEKYILSLVSQHCLRNENNITNFENQTVLFDENKQFCYYYIFWSDNSIMELVRDRFPHLERLFQSYPRLERSDAARYLILHEFGGIYADMDNEFVRPIDQVIKWSFSSLFAHLPYIRQWPTLRPHLECTLMMSAPRHPFLRLLIDSLQASRNAPDVYWRTGPEFLTRIYNSYLSSPGSNRTSECKRDPTSRRDCATVPLPTRLFYPYIAGPFPHVGPENCKHFLSQVFNNKVQISVFNSSINCP